MHNYFVNFILLSESWFIPELFLSISTLFLICYGLFSYNLRLFLIQESTINLTLLVLFFCLLLLFNFNHFYDILKLVQHKVWFHFFDGEHEQLLARGAFYADEFVFHKELISPSDTSYFLYNFTGSWSSPLFNNSRLDALSYLFKILIIGSSILCLVMFKDFVSTSKINFFEYSVVILLCLVGSLVICSANDFLTVYVAIELQSLSLYVLAAFKRKSFSSIESGLKYFVLGAFSSGFFLFGVSLLYGLLGTLNFDDIAILTADKNYYTSHAAFSFLETHIFHYNNEHYNFSDNYGILMNKIVLFILLSLLFKLALAPFHAWSPDIYENSPTSSSFFFSVVTKLSILALFLKLYCIYFSFINYNWKYIITIIGVASILVGCVGGVEQRKIKTLLAYSSISHLGYIILSLSCDSPLSLQMSVGYIVLYVLSSLSVWSLFFFVDLKKTSNLNKHNKDLGDLSLLKKSNILLAVCFSTYLFSIAGIPPLAGFLAKVNIFLTLLHHESMVVISLLSIIGSVISTFLYIRVVKILFFEIVFVGRLYFPIKKNTPVLLSVFVVLPLLIFIIPNTFYCLIEKYGGLFNRVPRAMYFSSNSNEELYPTFKHFERFAHKPDLEGYLDWARALVKHIRRLEDIKDILHEYVRAKGMNEQEIKDFRVSLGLTPVADFDEDLGCTACGETTTSPSEPVAQECATCSPKEESSVMAAVETTAPSEEPAVQECITGSPKEEGSMMAAVETTARSEEECIRIAADIAANKPICSLDFPEKYPHLRRYFNEYDPKNPIEFSNEEEKRFFHHRMMEEFRRYRSECRLEDE